jgi:branched-chain amino acid aminotransferase
MSDKLHIGLEKVAKSKIASVNFDELKFGKVFSDHMFVVDYSNGSWGQARIIPFDKMKFNPSLVVFHYGQAVFEGLKAYINKQDEILLFRPELHAQRLNASAERLCMPVLPETIFLEGLYALLAVDKQWIPRQENSSLYVRPLMIATDETLGVAPSKNYTFIIMTCPVSTYYEGSVKVIVEKEYVRAAEGGVGFAKTAGNYAASLYPALLAQQKGYDQLLWTDAKEHKYIEESGTMNVMFEIDGKIITPQTTSSILSGITRRSVVDLAKKWGVPLEERRVSIQEIKEAYQSGKLTDAFGTGTAATISHIAAINLDGEDIILPAPEKRGFSNKAKDYLSQLKIGKTQDDMGWMKKI